MVTDYFENALDRCERERFESHVATCSACAAYLRQMRVTIERVAATREAPFADSL